MNPREAEPSAFFLSSYVEARARFLKAAQDLRASRGGDKVSLHTLELKDAGDAPLKGHTGENLTIDICWMGSRQPRVVLVHSCGVHGVEGFAGSAIQVQALSDKAFAERFPTFPSDVAIVFIHAVNPFGMSHLRRWNENNVDLNRNFLSDQLFPQSIEKSLMDKTKYDHFKDYLTPSAEPWSWYLNSAYNLAYGTYLIAKFGFEIMKTLPAGQFHNPKGLFYGGTEVEQSHRLISTFLTQYLSSSEHYIHVDIHTGLGKWGHDMLVMDKIAHGSDPRFAEVLGEHKVDSFGYNADGSLPLGLSRLFSSDPEAPPSHSWLGKLDRPSRVNGTKSFSAVTQEFGTYSGISVLEALRIENFYHQRYHKSDPKNLQYLTSKKALLDTFTPLDPQWRSTVLERGQWLLNRLLTHAFSK